MTSFTDRAADRPSLIAFLRQELAPQEGRGLAMARIATGCVITVAVAMVFRIPLAAYMAYVIFLISKDDVAGTAKMAVGGALAITLAVVVSLCLAQISFGDPAIRLPAMALITFLAMFSARTFALGPVSFLAGFIVVTMQSIVDEVPNPEVFTRTTLWLWVVVLVPVAVTVIINLLFGPAASAVAQRGLKKVLVELKAGIAEGHFGARLPDWRAALVPLVEKAKNPAAVRRLLEALVVFEDYPDPLPPQERAQLLELLEACLRTLDRKPSAPSPSSAVAPASEATPAVLAIGQTLRELSQLPTPESKPAEPEQRRLFVPDAMSNPVYWQFALKTTIAIMIVYSVYSLLDWPGLLTSIVTVFFVALGSVGETIHKLTLRLSGAMIGGAIAGLSIVFVLPHFTDIGQLCAWVGAIALFAAWISTSSERLSYAGMQIALAFFMGMLQTYSPATDLTVLRDRVVGILLGNIVMTLVFSTLWPESIRSRLRAELVNSLKSIALLLRSPGSEAAVRPTVIAALSKADNSAKLGLFEMQVLPAQLRLPDLRRIERLAGAAFIVSQQPPAAEADRQAIASLSDWLERSAGSTAVGHPPPPMAHSGTLLDANLSKPVRRLRAAALEVAESSENSPV